MATKGKSKKSTKQIKDLKPSKSTAQGVKGGYVPPGIQIQRPGLGKKLSQALQAKHTDPPIQ